MILILCLSNTLFLLFLLKYKIPKSLMLMENKNYIFKGRYLKKPILLKKVYFKYELLKYLQEWAT